MNNDWGKSQEYIEENLKGVKDQDKINAIIVEGNKLAINDEEKRFNEMLFGYKK